MAADSRTVQIGFAGALMVFLLAKRFAQYFRPWHAWAFVTSFLALGTWLVYTSAPGAYSNRANIWRLGHHALGEWWPIGRGLSSWTPEVLERNYMHSQSLFLLYSGGAVALILFGVLVCISFARQPLPYLAFSAATVTFTMLRGLIEISWNPLALDGSTILILPIIVLACGSSDSTHPKQSRSQLPSQVDS